jgi:amidase
MNITDMSATARAKAIRAGRLSSLDASKAFLARIAERNGAINALVLVDDKGALAQARAADRALAKGKPTGPLHGVPITVKEAFDVAGWRTTSSHPPLAENIATRDATAVARLKAAGAVILGKTNVPELCMDMQCNSPLFGEAKNPWDLARTPGGSTGGGGAAVAARLTPFEIGSDIGGSVRIPSHFCGVYGLKTSEWRVPGSGHVPDMPGLPKAVRYMGTFGFLAHTVSDLRIGLEVTAGPDGVETEVPPVPLVPVKIAPQQSTIAWAAEWPFLPVSADTRRVVEELAGKLRRAGFRMKNVVPQGIELERAWAAWSELVAYMTRTFEPLASRQKYFAYADSPDLSRRATGKAAKLEMPEFARVLDYRDQVIRAMEGFFGQYDAFIAPVVPFPAFVRQRSGGSLAIDGKAFPYWQAATSYSFLANFTGQPAVSIPAGASQEGLPIGVQLMGARWGEMKLLAIAQQIEKLLGPCPKPPGY